MLPCAEEFATILPAILTYLTSVFRFVRCAQTRDDMLAESVGLCWKWFVRVKEKGKNPAEFPTALARFAARAVRAGRTVCGSQRAKDVMSVVARHRHGVAVEYFGRGPSACPKCHSLPASVCCNPYEEYLCENDVTPVPDQVVFRIDWPAFVDSLTERDGELMYFLGLGNSNQDAAREFGISPGRVSQLRKGWAEKWCEW